MIRAFGKSPRIAIVASIPLIFGICRSISVTSGRCFLNSVIASAPLDASATNFMSGSALTSAAIPLRRSAWSSTVRIRITPASLGMRPRSFAEQPKYAGVGGLWVRDRCGDNELDLRARACFAPEIQFRANKFRAFADSGQAPMSSARTFTEHLRVNAYSVIANPQAEQPIIVANFDFDLFGARMSESVSQDLAANTIDLILNNRR